MRNDVFHDVVIGGIRFLGVMSVDGPYISAEPLGGVALGVCSIAFVAKDKAIDRTIPAVKDRLAVTFYRDAGPKEWWLVKYSDETRIHLGTLSENERRQLADEFGIPISIHGAGNEKPGLFFTSPAFDSLTKWVEAHPKLAKRYSEYDTYLSGWYEKAKDRTNANKFRAR